MGTSRTVLHQYFIKAPPANVFKAISDKKEPTRWFLSKALLAKEKGGAYKFTWQGGHTESGNVLEYVQGKAGPVLAKRLEKETLRPDTGHVHCGEARKRNSPQAPAFGMGN